ncbi:F-box protein At4g18380-like [Curcuma longa]|uniref:F-box protein At4g18380-like n=1 Tax=Curcuma longa TaxID=136217 RepID=UPI003D9E260A
MTSVSEDPIRSRGHTAVAEVEDWEGIDHFDLLPDCLVLVVFNLLGDVKDLGRCRVLCRRFHALAQLVESVVVRIDCVISDDSSTSSATSPGGDRGRGMISHLARIVLGGIVKPLQALGHILAPSASVASGRRSTLSPLPSSSSSTILSDVSHHSPAEVLKNFKGIRYLRIELPAGELGLEDGVLLKWRAEFGSTLNSCVILGAASVLSSASFSPISSNPNPDSSFQDACLSDDSGSMPESFYSNGNLKRRLFWTISSMIAASARHYLLQSIISDHETLETLELTDVDGQGLLTMSRQQLQECRMKPLSTAGSSQRTLVPALSMRLWYAPHLELHGGVVLEGATLVAVRPSQEWGSELACYRDCDGAIGSSDMGWISSAFKEPYRSAVAMLVKRRSYTLEMNSF